MWLRQRDGARLGAAIGVPNVEGELVGAFVKPGRPTSTRGEPPLAECVGGLNYAAVQKDDAIGVDGEGGIGVGVGGGLKDELVDVNPPKERRRVPACGPLGQDEIRVAILACWNIPLKAGVVLGLEQG